MDKPTSTTQKPHPLPPSTRLYIILETTGSALSLFLTVFSLIVFKVSPEWGAKVFGWFFYPSVLCIALTLFLSVTQLLRGFELTVFLPIIPTIASIVCIILMCAYQVNAFGVVYIPPFNIFRFS